MVLHKPLWPTLVQPVHVQGSSAGTVFHVHLRSAQVSNAAASPHFAERPFWPFRSRPFQQLNDGLSCGVCSVEHQEAFGMLGGCRARAAETEAREAEQAALTAAKEATERALEADKDRVAAVKAAKAEAAAAVSRHSDCCGRALAASGFDAGLGACASPRCTCKPLWRNKSHRSLSTVVSARINSTRQGGL